MNETAEAPLTGWLRSAIAATLLLTASGVVAVRAQIVGDRVRITQTRPRLGVSYIILGSRLRFSNQATDVGTVAGIKADTILLTPDHSADTVAIALRWITQLDVSRGRESNVGSGIAYGALIGLGVGTVGGVIACQSQPSCYRNQGQRTGDWNLVYGVLGAALTIVPGAIVGGIIGAARSGEHWEQVPQDRWHLSLTPQAHGRLGLGASIPF